MPSANISSSLSPVSAKDVFDEFKNPLLIEISYCFNKNVYYPCPGYWDDNLNWFEGFFKPEDFMIKDIIDDAFKT